MEQYQYWAFPPGAVMPLPIPAHVFEGFRDNRALRLQDKLGYTAAMVVTLVAVYWSYVTQSPMPVVAAFCFCAIAIATLEEDIV